MKQDHRSVIFILHAARCTDCTSKQDNLSTKFTLNAAHDAAKMLSRNRTIVRLYLSINAARRTGTAISKQNFLRSEFIHYAAEIIQFLYNNLVVISQS